jgi:diguanylate cyclase (GGDEF)-like protein/PAS domain S-box-containing protein
LLLSSASDGIHILDSQGNIVDFSDSFANMLGYSREETANLNVRDWDAQIEQEQLVPIVNNLMASIQTFDTKHRRKDGLLLDVEIHAKGITLAGKHYLYASSRDITERKQAERRLHDSEERLALASFHNGVGIWDWNLTTGELVWDESMFALYHINRGDFPRAVSAWEKSLHPDDRERCDQEVQETICNNNPYDTVFRVVWPNSEVHFIKAVAKLFHDETGKPVRMLGTNIDITERKALEDELKRQAQIDYLTGVSNRGYFMQQAEQEFSRTARYGNSLTLLMLDVDFFKKINDNYGHKAGDTVLKKLAEISLGTFREVDTVGRLGGEEFAILLKETCQEDAFNVAERLRKSFADERVVIEDHTPPIHFTVSMGLATLTTRDKTIDSLLIRADKALYEAKETGRNKVCIAR